MFYYELFANADGNRGVRRFLLSSVKSSHPKERQPQFLRNSISFPDLDLLEVFYSFCSRLLPRLPFTHNDSFLWSGDFFLEFNRLHNTRKRQQ